MVRQSNALAVSSIWYIDVRILTLNLILNKMQCKNLLIKQETDYFLVFWSNRRTGGQLNRGWLLETSV